MNDKRRWSVALAGLLLCPSPLWCEPLAEAFLELKGSLAQAKLTSLQDAAAGRQEALPPEVAAAVAKGLAALAEIQKKNGDGSFGKSVPVAGTALAGLAFLAGGHLPGRSAYGEVVTAVATYLMSRQNEQGYINERDGDGNEVYKDGSVNSGMYGHGYAVLFLSQLYGSGGDTGEDIRKAIKAGVKFIESAQSQKGGWLYRPNDGDEGSVTITQVQALRGAREAGVAVSETTVKKALAYIEESTNDEGRTRYSLHTARFGYGPTSLSFNRNPSITAGGMCVFDSLGRYRSEKAKKGLAWILASYKPGSATNKPSIKGDWSSGTFWYFYGNFYATLAMYQAGGDYWKEWAPLVQKSLVASQSADGRWLDAESSRWGETIGTAFAVLTLQIPYKILPVFQAPQD